MTSKKPNELQNDNVDFTREKERERENGEKERGSESAHGDTIS